jgi:hypothetical protein
MTIQETGHCEERSDVAIPCNQAWQSPSFKGLLRFARNDVGEEARNDVGKKLQTIPIF